MDAAFAARATPPPRLPPSFRLGSSVGGHERQGWTTFIRSSRPVPGPGGIVPRLTSRKAIGPKKRRAAIERARVEFDHADERRHEAELYLGAAPTRSTSQGEIERPKGRKRAKAVFFGLRKMAIGGGD